VMYSPKTATAANEVVNFQTWTNNLNFMVWNGTNADAGNTNNWTPKRLPTRSDNVWFPAGASSSPTGTINCATFYAVANAPTPASAGLILNGNVMQTYGASGFGYTEIYGDVWASNTTAYSFGSSGTKVYGNTQLRGGMYGYSSALFCGDVLMQTNSFDRQISNAGVTNFKGRVQVAELGTVYWPGSSMGSSNIMFNLPARMMTASNIVTTNLTFGGYAVSWKTNTWWAYATSNATEKTAYTNTYLGR